MSNDILARLTLPTHTQDFGHSLVGGYSKSYQPDLVLHATSAPVNGFKDRLITDLATMVKVWIRCTYLA